MSQYRRPAMGGASRNGDYRYKRQEEDEDTDYQYFPIGTGYGAGEALTNLNNRLSSQIAQPPPRKPQLLKSPMSSRQDGGNNGRPQKIPQVLRVPSNNGNGNSNGNRGPPSRPARSNYVPSMLDPSDVQEQVLNPRFSYRPNQPPIRPQPRAPRLSEEDVGNPASPTNRPSMSSSRSIYIGFDPTNSQATTPSAASTLGVIPNSPSVPPPIPTVPNQQRRSSNGPPPTARRGTSSYYSQQTLMVSPIPEEPFSDRHDSYASSTAIPSSWGAGPAEFDPRGEEESFGDGEVEEFRLPTGGDAEDDERGLVRQASLGRKSKPTITEIKSIDRIKSPDREFGSKSSNESMKTASSGAGAFGGIGIGFSSPAEKNSPTLKLPSVGSPTSVPGLALGQSPVSSRSASSSPLAQPPIAFTREDYDESSGFPFPNSLGHSKGISSDSLDSGGLTATGKFPTGTTKPGRRLPPRLNMDAVRDAEARGSLTSLPDLIRRATKLAAVLETGRPDSRWGMRGSYMDRSSIRSNGRETDSISDILASFPPPVLASSRQGRRATAMSQWPLPGDFNNENNSSIRPSREQGRRICGLPLWAFILLVILALLVISAAVIVPLQLVKLSKGDKGGGNDSGKSVLAECRSKNPCQNGGENIATSTFCGCVCTSGFTGANCTQKEDSSCTTVDLQDLQGGRVKGIQNVTMGTALPRLFNLAEPSYNIKLDRAMILAVFSKEDISCTAQNALVRFNGESMPSTNGKRSTIDETPSLLQRRQDLTVDRSPTPTVGGATPSVTSSSSASSATKTAAVDSDAVDFARVTVLYLTNARNLSVAEDAQYRLQVAFSGGIDFGDLAVGSNITVDFNNRSIRMADGDIIGGITANSTGNSGGNRTSNSGSKKRSVLEDYFRTLFV